MDEVLKKLATLGLSDRKFCFISHHKRGAAMEARFLKDRICALLKFEQSNLVFLDSDQSHLELNELLTHVSTCQSVLLLQTKETFQRPFVIAEVAGALKQKIPVVAVTIRGQGYDFKEASEFLTSPDFRKRLNSDTPGCVEVLEKQGIEVQEAGKLLAQVIPTLISKEFDPSASARIQAVQVEEIVEALVDVIADYARKSRSTAQDYVKVTQHQQPSQPAAHQVVPSIPVRTFGDVAVRSVAVSPNGAVLASGADKDISIWDVETGSLLKTLVGHMGSVDSLDFSPDGRFLASTGGDGKTILWDTKSWTCARNLEDHKYVCYSVRFSPTSTMVASTGGLFDVASGNKLADIPQSLKAKSIFFTGDGISLGFCDINIQLWNLGLGNVQQLPIQGYIDLIAVSPNGLHVVIVPSYLAKHADIFDFPSCAPKMTLYGGHDDGIRCLCWSTNGSFVATGGSDRAVCLWHLSGTLLKKFSHAHMDGWVFAVKFSPDDRRLFSGGVKAVKMWNL